MKLGSNGNNRHRIKESHIAVATSCMEKMNKSYNATQYSKASGIQLVRANSAVNKVHINPKGTSFAGKCTIGDKEYKAKMKKVIDKYDRLSW